MRLIILISLIVAINCQRDAGFQLDPYKILGAGNPMNSMNQMNPMNGFNNNLNSGLNSAPLNERYNPGLSGPMMGMIMGGNNNNNNMQAMASAPQQPMPQAPVSGLPSANSYPGQQIQRLPFSDDLQYPSNPQPLPVPQAPVSTPFDYKTADSRTDYITSPGNAARLPQIQPIPDALPSNQHASVSPTANLFNSRGLQGRDGYGLLAADPLFPPVPLNPQQPPNQAIRDRIANDFNWGTKYFGNLLGNNRPNNIGPQSNALPTNGGYDNGLYNSGLNNLATSASSYPVASTYPNDNKIPIEISEYSTKIVHDAPARPGLRPNGPYKLNRS